VEQNELLRYAVDALEQMNVSYALVGSFASGIHGEPRFTEDIDIVVELFPYQIARFCKRFPSPEFYLSEMAVREAIRLHGQFNVIHPASGNKIDFMLNRTDPWGKNQLSRRQPVQLFPDRSGFVASPEDVILGKMIYYREGGSEKHLRDITGILRVSGASVDRQYVARFAEQLGVTDVWEAVLRRLGQK
jgi:predicted nucleotidyltransferase